MKRMKKNMYLLGVLLIAFIGMLTACSEPQTTENNPAIQSPAETDPPSSEESSNNSEEGSNEAVKDENEDITKTNTKYPLQVTDASGVTWEMAIAPERIVSTSPAETEILFALGLGDKIVAVSDFCDFPAEAAKKDKIGGIVTPNIEAILAADPDLVVTGMSLKSELVGQMRDLGLNVYSSAPLTVNDIMINIERLGQLTDTQEQAEELVAQMKADIDQVKQAVAGIEAEKKKRVYVEFAPGWTVGKGEYLHELINMSGAVNIAEEIEGWAQINEEQIIQQDPEVILYPKGLVDFQTEKPIETLIESRNGWNQITAIKNGALYGLNEDLLTIPGPRITQGLIEMAKAIYPDLVK